MQDIHNDAALYLPGHFQYLEDFREYNERRMFVEISNLGYIANNLTRQQVVTLSRTSPLLTARAFGLSGWNAIHSYGEVAFWSECPLSEVAVGYQYTSSSAQPHFVSMKGLPRKIDKDDFTA